MKAIVMNEYGGPEVLKYADFPDPAPGPGEVLIRVAAASINPVDLMQRSGGTKAYFPIEFPGVIGWDLSGTILRPGPGVKDFSVGDKVFAWAFHTYAELCVVKTEILAKVPDGLDMVEAAALPLVTMTGSQLISVASSVKAGQTILISGAVGSVARAAVCTAKDKGAVVIAGVRKDQADEAKSLGVDRIVALDDEAAFKALPPVDVVANTVRGKSRRPRKILLAVIGFCGVLKVRCSIRKTIRQGSPKLSPTSRNARKPSSQVMPQNRHETGFRGPSPDVGKATQFKPGVCANPGGRPKSKLLSEAYRRKLEDIGQTGDCSEADRIAEAIVNKAASGFVGAAHEIADRTEGKAVRAVTLTVDMDEKTARIIAELAERLL
jgi:Alcohol dehydrogenase GroES-like domain/Family of unknown function (DUF5681)